MSQDIPQKIEFSGSKAAYEAIKTYLDQYHGDISYDFSANEEKALIISIEGKSYTYDTPIRLGHVLDRLFASLNDREPKTLHFKTGILNTILNSFSYNGSEDDVVLTEKEVEILTYLHAHKGEIVTREDLLKKVWNYADSVETHTAETHIYRLRQKIEKDPASPEIILTAQDGYMVAKD